MDENLAWKVILVAAIFSLIVMGVVYSFLSPKESPYFTEEKMEKIAEFANTRVSGRKEGKKVWEFYADEGWTGKNRHVNYLYNVKDGKIYSQSKLVVYNLIAPRAKAYRRSEIVEAFGFLEDKPKGKSKLSAYINLGRISKGDQKSEWSKMRANQLKYFPKQKRSEISGDAALYKRDSSIFAQRIIVYHEQKFADVTDDITLRRKDGRLQADFLKYYSEDEKLEADGHVDINIIEGKTKTRLKANHASFYTEMSKNMDLQGNLEVAQGKKLAISNSGVYSQKRKQLTLRGKVKAIFEKAKVLLKAETVKKLKTEEGKKILKEKTILTSNQLIISTKTGDAQASGSVVVTQKGREAKANHAVYDDKTEIITLTGNVYMKKGKEWVKAKKVVVSVKNETFEAVGAVEAEFKL